MTDNQEPQLVALSGDVTMRAAEAVREHLLAAVRSGRHVVIDCSDAAEVDLTTLQQIAGARRSVGQAGGTLSLRAPVPGVLLGEREVHGRFTGILETPSESDSSAGGTQTVDDFFF